MALENGIRNLFFLSVFFFAHFAILSRPVNPGRLKRKWPVIPTIDNLFNLKFEAGSYFLKSSSLHVCTEEGLQNSCDQ